MKIDIIWEDPVTYSIIERLIKDYRPDIIIANKLPSRWWEIKKLAPLYNKIAGHIFLLTDLDWYECPPSMIKWWFWDTAIVDTLLFRIAHDEAESWLMADKIGFSKWLGIDIKKIPPVKIIDNKKWINELSFPYKPSLYMMRELVPESKNKDDALYWIAPTCSIPPYWKSGIATKSNFLKGYFIWV